MRRLKKVTQILSHIKRAATRQLNGLFQISLVGARWEAHSVVRSLIQSSDAPTLNRSLALISRPTYTYRDLCCLAAQVNYFVAGNPLDLPAGVTFRCRRSRCHQLRYLMTVDYTWTMSRLTSIFTRDLCCHEHQPSFLHPTLASTDQRDTSVPESANKL